MNSRRNMQGITLISFIMLLALGAFFGYCFLQLRPVYAEYVRAGRAVWAICKDDAMAKKSLREVRARLDGEFKRDEVTSVMPGRNVRFVRDGSTRYLVMEYESRNEFYEGFDLVAKFKRQCVMGGKAEAK